MESVVLNCLGVVRLQCSSRRGNSFSIAHHVPQTLEQIEFVGGLGFLRFAP